MPLPYIRVVVVNFNGGALTVRCLESLLCSDWPSDRLDVVMVDNASTDGLADRLESEGWPVRVIRSTRNLGFAGGCNLGLDQLEAIDYVALVNNDAVVDAGWLTPLVSALECADDIGATCPLILLDAVFQVLDLATDVSRRRGDRRALGVRISGVRVDGVDVTRTARFTEGSWGPEPGPDGDTHWTGPTARLVVPVPGGGSHRIGLRAEADTARTLTVETGDGASVVEVGPAASWLDLTVDCEPVELVNSAGVRLRPDLYAEDRGWLQMDDERWRRATEVFAWSGAAVLLRAEMLAEIGLFDERLFMYYEDLDLSWRGRRAGWRHVYEPASVVRHRHAGATTPGSALAHHFAERNRLVVLTKHAPAGAVARAVLQMLAVTCSYGLRDVMAPLLQLRRPVFTTVRRRLGSFAGYLRLLPSTTRLRRPTSRRDLRRWMDLDGRSGDGDG